LARRRFISTTTHSATPPHTESQSIGSRGKGRLDLANSILFFTMLLSHLHMWPIYFRYLALTTSFKQLVLPMEIIIAFLYLRPLQQFLPVIIGVFPILLLLDVFRTRALHNIELNIEKKRKHSNKLEQNKRKVDNKD